MGVPPMEGHIAFNCFNKQSDFGSHPRSLDAGLSLLCMHAVSDTYVHETVEEREVWLQYNNEPQATPSNRLTPPSVCTASVCSKIAKIHSKLAAVQVSNYITCLEKFPGLNVNISLDADWTKYVRCRQGKHIPKATPRPTTWTVICPNCYPSKSLFVSPSIQVRQSQPPHVPSTVSSSQKQCVLAVV